MVRQYEGARGKADGFSRTQLKLRASRTKQGLDFHRRRAKATKTVDDVKERVALAKQYLKPAERTIWLKPTLSHIDGPMQVWSTYEKQDWTPELRREYTGFWKKVIRIYENRLAQIQARKALLLSKSSGPPTRLMTAKDWPNRIKKTGPAVRYNVVTDRSCGDGEFYLEHPKTKKRCKCRYRDGAARMLKKSWSSGIAKKYPGGRWVTITDPSSPLKGRHIFLVPHKGGTATIAWAPEQSGLTHKVLQPKRIPKNVAERREAYEKRKEEREKKKPELSEQQVEKLEGQKREITTRRKVARTKLHEMIREKVGVETEVTEPERKEIQKKVEKIEHKEQQKVERLREFNRVHNEKRQALNKIIAEAKKVMLAEEMDPGEDASAEKKRISQAVRENAEDFLKAWYTIKANERELRAVSKVLQTGHETKAVTDIVEVVDITGEDVRNMVESEKALQEEIDSHYNLIVNTRGGIDREGNEITKKGTGSTLIKRNMDHGAYEAISGVVGELAGTSVVDEHIAAELGPSNVAVLADYYLRNTLGSKYKKGIDRLKKYVEEKGTEVAEDGVGKGDKFLEMAQRVKKFGKGEESLYGSIQQAVAASLAYTNRAYQAYGQAEGALNQVAELLYQFGSQKPRMTIKATNRPALYNKIRRLGLNKGDVSIIRHGYGDYDLRIPQRSYEKLIKERVVRDWQPVTQEPSPQSIKAGRENTDTFHPTAIKTHLPPDKDRNMQVIKPFDVQQSSARLFVNQKRIFLNHEAGTGKSFSYVLAKAHLEDKIGKRVKTIISMPSSVMGNFKREVEKFSHYKVEIVESTSKAKRQAQYNSDPNTIIVVNKEKFHFDRDMIRDAKFQMVVADEAHRITQRLGKGERTASQMSKGLEVIAGEAEYYIAGSGTPNPNDLSELYFHLKLIDPGKFSSRKAFMAKYRHLHKGAGYKEKLAEIMNAELDNKVYTQKQTLPINLYEKLHTPELTEKQRNQYQKIQSDYLKRKINPMQRDQRIANVLNQTHWKENRKYDAIRGIIDGHLKKKGDTEKISILAENYATVRVIEDFLKKNYPQYKSVRFAGRDANGKAMKTDAIGKAKHKILTDPKAKFAIHTKAGTEGLNIQHSGEAHRPYGVTTMISMLSGANSYAMLDQFNHRGYRKKANKDVHAHLILSDTPLDMTTEERLTEKRAVMGLVNNAQRYDEADVLPRKTTTSGVGVSKAMRLPRSIRMRRVYGWV